MQTGNTVGVQRSLEGAMHVLVNGCDLGPAAAGIPEVAILCSNVRHSQAYPIFILTFC